MTMIPVFKKKRDTGRVNKLTGKDSPSTRLAEVAVKRLLAHSKRA